MMKNSFLVDLCPFDILYQHSASILWQSRCGSISHPDSRWGEMWIWILWRSGSLLESVWKAAICRRGAEAVSAVFPRYDTWILPGTSVCSAGRTVPSKYSPLTLSAHSKMPTHVCSHRCPFNTCILSSTATVKCLTGGDDTLWRSLRHQDVKTISQLVLHAPLSPLLSVPPMVRLMPGGENIT